MTDKLSVVIPAFNVDSTIEIVVQEMLSFTLVDEVIVSNNNSQDRTEERAKAAGATLINCNKQGMGYAIKEGAKFARNNLVMKIDGDIRNPNKQWCQLLLDKISPNTLFANCIYHSDYDEFPVGNLTAKPALEVLFPELLYVKIPLSGTYIYRADKLNIEKLPNDWSFDIALLMLAHEAGSTIEQAEIGYLNDEPRKISDYRGMSTDILRFLFNKKIQILQAK